MGSGNRGVGRSARPGPGGEGTRRWGRSLPVAFLLLSLAVAGFGALEAYRAQQSHHQTAQALLTDYSEFAAWSYERSSFELLRSSIDAHLSIAYSNAQFAQGHATQQCLYQILEPVRRDQECNCGVHLAGEYSFFTRLGEPVSESMWVGTLPESMEQTIIVETVQQHARDTYRDDWQFAVAHVPEVHASKIVAYTLLESPTIIDTDLQQVRDTVLYGFEIDPQRLAALYDKALSDEVLLPSTFTAERRNDEVIGVEVVSPEGAVLYTSSPGSEMLFAAPVDRRAMFGGGEIRASVLPDVAGELIIGGLPRDRTGVLSLIFGLAAALAVLALLQLRREDQLALLRQDFVASVSHELRTPLAQVRLFTETLRLGRTKTEDQRSWALENIDRETRRLSNLVENILHFSRGERGVQHLDRVPADVGAETREAIASFAPLLPARKGTLESSIPDGLVADVHADSIRQVLLNLLDNAVRYGRDGQTIRVSGEAVGSVIRIHVDDEGAGVPDGERQRIFEPFRRGEGSVGTVVVGSGIGLAVVDQLITAHEGRIWVEDAPGGGARFSFELPAVHTALPRHFPGAPARDVGTSGVA
ncbi:MAG: HAMP domain-containing sensor histidine kinase [Gemmatimonadota bacterium]